MSHTTTDTDALELELELFADDLEAEELPGQDSLLGTCGCFSCAGSASCPVASASTASCIGCGC